MNLFSLFLSVVILLVHIEAKDPSDGYNFQDGMDGWTMSHMNGASWVRATVNSSFGPGEPDTGPWILQIQPRELFSATALAQSPLFEATDHELHVQLHYWMAGNSDFPVHLKVRKRNAIQIFEDDPIINLDAHGKQTHNNWLTESGNFKLTQGEIFVIVLEGSLGGQNTNQIAISEIIISGVAPIILDTSSFFYDFEDGLEGWSSGNMDGGRWILFDYYNDGGADLGIPTPVAGSNIQLFVEKNDLHSGIITIETPVLEVQNGLSYAISFKYWTKGTVIYPTALRLRLKTNGGTYNEIPFENLVHNGDVEHTYWISYSEDFTADIPSGTEYLQVVLEADVGLEYENLLCVDDLQIIPS